MNIRPQFPAFLAVVASAVLTACGGGGGDSATAPDSTARDQVDQVASLGVLTVDSTGVSVGQDFSRLGLTYLSVGSDTGGSRTAALTCSSGSGTANLVKAASQTGLSAGDSATFTYTNCATGGLVLNGTFKATALGALTLAPAVNHSVTFQADFTGLASTYNGVTRKYDGTAIVASSVAAGNTYTNGFSVPGSKTLNVQITGGLAPLSFVYGANTAFTGTDVTTPASATRKLDGSVDVAVANVGAVALTMATPTTLSGTTSATTREFSATAGVLNTKSTALNMATSATFSASGATVSGDTDKNGSLDLTYSTTWAALAAP